MKVFNINTDNHDRGVIAASSDAHADELLRDDELDVDAVQEDDSDEASKTHLKKNTKKAKALSVSVLQREVKLNEFVTRRFEQKQEKAKSKFEKKVTRNFKKEYQNYVKQSRHEHNISSLKDQAVLSQSASVHLQKTQQNQLQSQLLNKDSQPLFQSYLGSFAEDIVTTHRSEKKKATLSNARTQLLKKGISPRKIKQAEQTVQKMVHTDLKKELRRQFMAAAFSYEPKKFTLELLGNYHSFKMATQVAQDAGVFGEGRVTMADEKRAVESELRHFITDEMDYKLISTKLTTDDINVLVKVFDDLNNLVNFINFSPDDYMKQFHAKLDHFGLNYFVDPNVKGRIDSDDSDESDRRQKRNKKKESLLVEEEDASHSIEDRLRALYSSQYTVTGVLSTLKLKIKIKQCEHKLKRTQTQATIESIRSDAKKMAKLRCMFMLRDAFEERATLPHLKGEVYKLVKSKIKMSLKGLKAVGSPVSRSDRNDIRDQSNRSMFTLIKEEYIKLTVHLEVDSKNSLLRRRCDELFTILNRLKEETKINEEVKPKLMQDMHFLSDINITEAV